jgi:hypothetical protein
MKRLSEVNPPVLKLDVMVGASRTACPFCVHDSDLHPLDCPRSIIAVWEERESSTGWEGGRPAASKRP